MVSPTTVGADQPAPVGRSPRVSLTLLRVWALLHLVFVLAQPVLAGIYLNGDIDAIAIHGANANLLTLVAFAQFLAAIGYATAGGGRWWPVWFSFLLMLVEETQKAFGYLGQLGLHVPLGVTIVVTVTLFAIWTFSASANRPRRRRGGAR